MALAVDVIDGIYAAALDAQRWPEAVRRMAGEFASPMPALDRDGAP